MEHESCSIPFPCLNRKVKCTGMCRVIARAANMATLTACTASFPCLSLPILQKTTSELASVMTLISDSDLSTSEI